LITAEKQKHWVEKQREKYGMVWQIIRQNSSSRWGET
jgi:hypothetical protein